MAASISECSDHVGDSTDHAMPHFCQSYGSICVSPSPSDHGIVSYMEMMSMPNDIDFAKREVKLSFFSMLNACNLSISKLNSKPQEIFFLFNNFYDNFVRAYSYLNMHICMLIMFSLFHVDMHSGDMTTFDR